MKKLFAGCIVVSFAAMLAACGDDDSDFASRPDGKESSSTTPSSKVIEPAEVTTGTMTDSRDDQTYNTVTIGTQTWMAENLNYETANSYCFNDYATYCTKYGRFYAWAAAMDSAGTWSTNGKGCGHGSKCSPTGTIRGICPEGWHLPSQTEWEVLFTAVGGISTAGKMLKSATGWNDSGNGTDAFAFTALPGGSRSMLGFYYIEGIYAYFWSSTEYDSEYAYYMHLKEVNDNAILDYDNKYYGLSVRCLKD